MVRHIADCEQFFADRMKRTVAMDRPLLLGGRWFPLPGAAALPGPRPGTRTRPGGRHPATDGPNAPAHRPRRLAAHRHPQRNRAGDAAATAAPRHQPPAPRPAVRGRETGGDDDTLSLAFATGAPVAVAVGTESTSRKAPCQSSSHEGISSACVVRWSGRRTSTPTDS